LLVVALGGNALQDPVGDDSVEADLRRTADTARLVAGLVLDEGWRLVVTHGNGPQVGNHLLRRELAHVHGRLPDLPLDVCVADTQGGTTAEGIHLGAMAGTVDIVQRAYSGLEARGEVLHLHPHLPDDLDRLHFDVAYRDHWLHIDIDHHRLQVASRPCAAATVLRDLAGTASRTHPGWSAR
jgi:hypothetical protein